MKIKHIILGGTLVMLALAVFFVEISNSKNLEKSDSLIGNSFVDTYALKRPCLQTGSACIAQSACCGGKCYVTADDGKGDTVPQGTCP
ncbi:MAG: hypothetical protein PHE43_00540 [Candidatus Nanoarchaeia archaeon]|nr:hypothetical protein [Candidatus Nanoarchaeia archaeon]